jgi:hypothetical protein
MIERESRPVGNRAASKVHMGSGCTQSGRYVRQEPDDTICDARCRRCLARATPTPGSCANLGAVTSRPCNAERVKVATAKKLILLEEQVNSARNGEPQDFEGWKAKTGMVLRTVLGESDPLVDQFARLKYTLGFSPIGPRKRSSMPPGDAA